MSKRKREDVEGAEETERPHKKLKLDDGEENFTCVNLEENFMTWEEMCSEVLNVLPRKVLHYREVKEEIQKKFFCGDEEKITAFSGKRCPFGLSLNAMNNNEEIFEKTKPGYYKLNGDETDLSWKDSLKVVVEKKLAWRERKKR